MNLAEVLTMQDDISGIELTAKVKKALQPKTFEGARGDFTTQGVVIQDLQNPKVECFISLGEKQGFMTSGHEGKTAIFTKCKKTSYTKDGEVKPKIECHGAFTMSLGAGDTPIPAARPQKTLGPNPPSPAPAPEKKVDWDKKDLLMARESAVKSASTIIAAQIQAGLLDKSIDLSEYAMRMGEFFANYFYNGAPSKEQEEIAKAISKEDEEEQFKVIRQLQSFWEKYEVSPTKIIELINEKYKKNYEVLQHFTVLELKEFMGEFVKRAIAGEFKPTKVAVPEKTVDESELF